MKGEIQSVEGIYLDLFKKIKYPARVSFSDGYIINVEKIASSPNVFIAPGFIDAHIHVESSMLTPIEFSKLAVRFGTVASINDPHEIANVCGVEGVEFMLSNALKSPFKFHFGAPSCVPATNFETSGANLGIEEVHQLLLRDDIYYLTEVMSFPGVLNNDPLVMGKINVAKQYNKPIDGHAPGLKGALAQKYASAGISTDHECFTIEEALDKISAGMKILIREGSAAKNFNALIPLMENYADVLMFCSDDLHPNDFLKGHINRLVAKSIQLGYDVFDTFRAACVNPVLHYQLNVGLLRIGDPADFIIIDNFETMHVAETYINGECVYQNNNVLIDAQNEDVVNHFTINHLNLNDLDIKLNVPFEQNEIFVNVIQAIEGQLITEHIKANLPILDNCVVPDVEQDILKIVVVNRYQHAQPFVAFIKGFGLQKGAIASTVAHDSHNIVCVGVDNKSIYNAINALIKAKGGISVDDGEHVTTMPLPIAGLMTNASGEIAAAAYENLDAMAKQLGTNLNAPFMTLSFMALPVIPNLKITDLGLFDVTQFAFTDLIVN